MVSTLIPHTWTRLSVAVPPGESLLDVTVVAPVVNNHDLAVALLVRLSASGVLDDDSDDPCQLLLAIVPDADLVDVGLLDPVVDPRSDARWSSQSGTSCRRRRSARRSSSSEFLLTDLADLVILVTESLTGVPLAGASAVLLAGRLVASTLTLCGDSVPLWRRHPHVQDGFPP